MDRVTIFNFVWMRTRTYAGQFRGQGGAALAEYGLLIAFIAGVCIAAVTLLGFAVASLFPAGGI